MLKVIEDRKREQKARYEVARRYATRLSSLCGKVTAIVYGSTAIGDFKDWSAIDIIIVAERLPADPMERLDFLYNLSEGLIEPKGFTAEEFRHIMRTPFGRLLEKEGVVITDELNILCPFREAF
ncbi:MAG: nucleotidyltransferase domain-containing protein [Nitrospirota bacterium]